MKKIFAVLTAFTMVLATALSTPKPVAAASEVRAAWMATVYNIDFPTANTSASAQKAEMLKKLDALQAVGINRVIFQVRPKADALYKSAINPWSDVLTGTQGQDPGYDPLAYMIGEAHARGMQVEAWLNPYRVTTKGTDVSVLAANHPARQNPSWVLSYNGALFYDPANEAVKQHICDTVAEIVRNYDVDGIHFDDYFYPANYPLSAGEGRDGAEANQRRADVNNMVRRVYQTVKSINQNVVFGISPVGIWKNNKSDSAGSATNGQEGYYSLFGDAKAWIDGGYVDYITPQLYWETGRSDANYETLVQWWSNAVKGTNVKLYIGQGIYKDAVSAEIDKQLTINTKYNVSGSFFYSTKDLLSNRQSVADTLKKYWANGSQSSSGQTVTEGVVIQSYVPKKAVASSAVFLADSKVVAVESYNLDGYTYFKLRDVAAALSGSEKSFSVGWNDSKRLITLKSGESYTMTGTELIPGDQKPKDALLCKITLISDGQEAALTAYNIAGNNYIKLRDLAKVQDFGVSWDNTSQTIGIWSSLSYTE